MEVFSVLSPGAYTTVQDTGRFGFQHMGVPVSGVLDGFAFRVANLLAGNPAGCAVLEMTVTGTTLSALGDAVVAVTGADMGATLNGTPVPGWSSFRMHRGDLLELHQVRTGCRAYLAVGGGFSVPVVMGSRSTYVGGGIGGFKGRPLEPGDILSRGEALLLKSPRKLPAEWIPDYPTASTVRAIPGPQDDFFDEGMETFFGSEFMVSAKADRMGYRLQGPEIPLRKDKPMSIISEPSMPGSVQIPADRQPIVLLVEQTVGGYTKIASVISADLSSLAQTTPGDILRFERITLEEAHRIYNDGKRRLESIARTLSGDR